MGKGFLDHLHKHLSPWVWSQRRSYSMLKLGSPLLIQRRVRDVSSYAATAAFNFSPNLTWSHRYGEKGVSSGKFPSQVATALTQTLVITLDYVIFFFKLLTVSAWCQCPYPCFIDTCRLLHGQTEGWVWFVLCTLLWDEFFTIRFEPTQLL